VLRPQWVRRRRWGPGRRPEVGAGRAPL